MSESGEEEARRRKILLDGSVAQLAVQNIGPVMSGEMPIDKVEELAAIDEEWLRRTRACMNA